MSNGYIGTSPVPKASRVTYSGSFATARQIINVPGGYTPGNIHVYINGSLLNPQDYDAFDGFTIDLLAEFPIGTKFFVEEFREFILTKDVSLIRNTFEPEAGITVLNTSTYTPGMNTISVFKNGQKLYLGYDYTESSSTTVTLTTPSILGDRFECFIVARAAINSDLVYASNVQFDNGVTGLLSGNVQEAIDEIVTTLARNELRNITFATAGQTVFPVNTYKMGDNSLTVYRDGQKLVKDVDYTETTEISYTLIVPALANECYESIVNKKLLNLNLTTDNFANLIEYDNGVTGLLAGNVQEAIDQLHQNYNNNSVRSVVTAIDGQTLFTTPTYVQGINSLAVYRDGQKLVLADDYVETSNVSITISEAAIAGEKLEFIVVSRKPIDPAATATAANVSFDAAPSGLGVGNVQEAIDKLATDYLKEADLLNTSDPTKGASLAGWLRKPLADSINTVQRMLDAQFVNIWEYASLVTNKPTPSDPNTWDWAPALQGAINSGFSVYVPKGIYNISTSINLSSNKLFGDSWRNAQIKASAAIDMLILTSSSVVENIEILGNGIALSGIRSPITPINRARVFGVRVENCSKGIALYDVQNSLLMECQVKFCDYNYYIDGIENCKIIHCNADLNNATRTVTTSTRSIFATNTYGRIRNLLIIGGIYERGEYNNYCMEFNDCNVTFVSTEFNNGQIATIKLTSNTKASFRNCAFTLMGTNYCVDADSTSTFEYDDATLRNISGKEGVAPPALFLGGIVSNIPLVLGIDNCTYNTKLSTYLTTGSLSDITKTYDIVSTANNMAAGARFSPYISDNTYNKFDTNFIEGRYYDIEVIITNITGSTTTLKLAVANSVSNRRELGTLNQGYNRIVVAADINDLCQFEIISGSYNSSEDPKSWKIKYIKVTLI